jgi:UDP-glucose:(heptosyl)LPS alpha-1,3-glucosyltransferase
MKFAFVIFKYFPYGGVQRDMFRIAQDCLSLGHEVTVFTGQWQGDKADNLKVVICKSKGWLNHQKHESLIQNIEQAINKSQFDLIVGFNRMAGLDVYFAADSCFVAKAHDERPWWYRYTPRFNWFQRVENAIFNAGGHCHILTLTEAEKSLFQRWYHTPDSRFHLIPPFLSKQRFGDPANPDMDKGKSLRLDIRTNFGFQADDLVLLLVGSGFKTKGADRAVLALDALPSGLRQKVKLLIIGQDSATYLNKKIAELGLETHVKVLGGRDDIPQLMQACDVLIHPARRELAGHVLLEAMACGLPVITTDQCGYAFHIKEAQAGVVLTSPFSQDSLNNALIKLLQGNSKTYQNAGRRYAQQLMQVNSGCAEASMLTNIADAMKQTPPIKIIPNTDNKDVLLWIAPKHQAQLKDMCFDDFMTLSGYTVRAAANRKTMRVSLNACSYFVKQHAGVGWKELIKNYLSAKRPVIGAMTEVYAIQSLTALGIHTTPIAAYGVKGRCAASQHSFLLTEDLGDIVSLEDICKTWVTNPPSQVERQIMLVAVAKLAKRFHGAGFSHRDFYFCHIALPRNDIVTEDTDFYLLDLHRVLHHQPVHGSAVRKDIAGLMFSCMDYGFTTQDWDVFKLHYLAQDAKFWQQVKKRAQKLYTRFNSDKFQKRVRAERDRVDY